MWVMSTRATGRKAFLAKVRGASTTTAPPKRSVNEKLEAMLSKMMEEAVSATSSLTFEQKMALGGLVLKVEAVRNKITDDDYGSGFLQDDDSPVEREPEPGLGAGGIDE